MSVLNELEDRLNLVPNEKVYKMVQKIHRQYDDFIDGDLGERLDEYDWYKLMDVPISKINLDEWDVQDWLVDDYVQNLKNSLNYPPVVLGSDYSIIDGIHRINALHKLGIETVTAYVGRAE